MKRLGIDIGSTTVKVAVIDEEHNILFSEYKRHFANIKETLKELVEHASKELGNVEVAPTITGSGGLALAQVIGIPFEQEVVCVSEALTDYAPQTDVAIELGGEDAKIIYFTNGVEQRMNGVCAGGTGSFIDQMASLLQTDASGLNTYAKDYDTIYPIAARCGVFAKTDIQPLINEGATKPNLAASIFQAVVNQTISGLACGKPIKGNVAFLGGPLHFLDQLKEAFVRTLNLTPEHIIAPGHSHLFAAVGAALQAKEETHYTLDEISGKLTADLKIAVDVDRLPPLFASQEDYDAFIKKQEKNKVLRSDLATYKGKCFLGVDAGSTTTKLALVGEDGSLLYRFYDNNNGSPLNTTIRAMKELKELLPPSAKISGSCSTGYGEALIKAALQLDHGEVETMAHYYAAAFFEPDVDCILDIGGQDSKVIRLDENGAVANFVMNDKCAAGTGRFLEMMARTMEMDLDQMSEAGLTYKEDITISSMCTVFAESEVVSLIAQNKETDDIVHGLNKAVASKTAALAKRVGGEERYMMTGGVSKNKGLVKTLEEKLGTTLVISDKAQLCGALGAALFAMDMVQK